MFYYQACCSNNNQLKVSIEYKNRRNSIYKHSQAMHSKEHGFFLKWLSLI